VKTEPRNRPEPKGEPEKSIEAPSIVWWMLAVVAIAGFVGLALWMR
jgi:hypothetical protein